jgi:hypothetical protein
MLNERALASPTPGTKRFECSGLNTKSEALPNGAQFFSSVEKHADRRISNFSKRR